ncbi:MAG: Alpha,alpha-trehalose-phosphate synthase [UDP-forming] [uncultured Acidimicrobiales bacterium]|uniref:Alpha,alpha-trehalose-phosphate synthase [UDP-forming] n=1 Tax=uncultured Acidimicrobiales bacterium TaxID=310071 RepID=A0A6J4IQ84_9ACTN|nr:MAG: Alpha,alpha-trehalose-phosphate synthase [UDP-forming] [uncultured Acidimicrobiales bacterium]
MVPHVEPDLVVVSNRGPLSFARDASGELTMRRAAGGLVSALGPGVAGRGATWIAAAITDDDREAAARGLVGAEGFAVQLLDIDAASYGMYYDVVANSTLWFLHHHMFDSPRRPRIDRRWREAWGAYRRVNERFATLVADTAPQGATVLVQDYHLPLLGDRLRTSRPDLATVHFNHTPFCEPDVLRMLPDGVGEELLVGLAGHRACGFHSPRWADAFIACCEERLGATPTTFVAPAAPDLDDVRNVVGSPASESAHADLEALVGTRKLIVRVDRIELSKNLLRGFWAYDDLLETYPEWRQQVVFAAFVYPSRQSLPEYLSYRSEVESVIERVNAKWGTPTWTPIHFDPTDNFPASVAGLRRYDALLVNPVRDGLNLVAKEGPAVNERDGVLLLSRESGAWDELAPWALEVNPFDVAGTADALHRALSMPDDERGRLAAGLRQAATCHTPDDWLQQQLAAAR